MQRNFLLLCMVIQCIQLCFCGREFNYHLFDIGPFCTTLYWSYTGSDCSPQTYALQGFQPDDVIFRNLNTPTVWYNSSSFQFYLNTNYTNLYYRSLIFDERGLPCNPSYSAQFYNFENLLMSGLSVICLRPQESSVCLNVPQIQSGVSLQFIWPKSSSHLDGYCRFSPLSSRFSDYASSCGSAYLFTSSRGRVCLQSGINRLLETNEKIKVYFLITIAGPHNSYFIFSYYGYQIEGQTSCNEQNFQNSLEASSICLARNVVNTTVIIQTRHPLPTLYLNITQEQGILLPQQIIWRHNGQVIQTSRDPRIVLNSSALIISEVQPSDAGCYFVTFTTALQCTTIYYNVSIEFLNSHTTAIDMDEGGINFTCTATGYPNPQLLMWQTGTGQIISDSQYITATSESTYSNTTLVTTLIVTNITSCHMSRGYVCILSNGGLISPVQAVNTLQCPSGPPSQPKVYYQSADRIICFDAYSHSDYPILLYNVVMSFANTQFQYTATENCSHLPVELFPGNSVCGPIMLSVTAINELGRSVEDSQHILDSSLCHYISSQSNNVHIRIHLEGVSNCEFWRGENAASKVEVISALLLNFIESQCHCDFLATNINQTTLLCYDNIMDVIAVNTQISTLNISILNEIFQNWASTYSSVVIQGELLTVNNDCSVVVSNSSDLDCLPVVELSKSTSLFTTTSTSRGSVWLILSIPLTVIILLTIIASLVLFSIACKKIKCSAKKKEDATKAMYGPEDSPIYEEIVDSAIPSQLSHKVIISMKNTEKGSTYGLEDCPAYESDQKKYEVARDNSTSYSLSECQAYGQRLEVAASTKVEDHAEVIVGTLKQ